MIAGLSLGKAFAYLAVVAVIVATLFGLYKSIYNSGYRAGEKLLADYIANQTVKTIEVERVVEKIVKEVEVKYVDRIREVKVKGEQIVVKVPVYITKTDDAACELRGGFVRAHDAAASNTPPGPAAESDRDPSGVALSEAAAVIADNYTRYHACREQVIGWNEFFSKYRTTVREAGCVPK